MAAPEGQARGVEIDIDGRMIGIRYPMDAHLIGDAKETLRVLIPMLERKSDRFLAGRHRGERGRVVGPATSSSGPGCESLCRAPWRPWAQARPSP
jgi:thiamine pyrophosphate-dependent acetolactate synthase large subunit-like protein